MANPYEQALAELTKMGQSAEALDLKLNNLGSGLESAIRLNPQADFSQTAEYKEYFVGLALRKKHIEWGRKIHGVLMGYSREMQSGARNLAKGREVGFQNADVTVGTNEPFAKAIQHKHTVSPDNAQVNEMIAKAANQLTGESGEKPLAGQRKIIDVMINDSRNIWPFDLKDVADLSPEVDLNDGVIPFDLFKTAGAAQILKQLSKYKKGKLGLDVATKNSLLNHNTVLNPGLQLQKNPAMPKSTARFLLNGQRAELLTIKIVYGLPRKFKNNLNDVTVRSAAFVAYNENGALKVEFLDYK